MTTPTDPTTLRTALEALYVAYDGLRAIAAFAPTRGIDSVVAEARRLADAIEPALATPAPAADEARCVVCGDPGSDMKHLPCGRIDCSHTGAEWELCHPFQPAPTPAPPTPPATERCVCGHLANRHTPDSCRTCDGLDGPFTGSCAGFQPTPPATEPVAALVERFLSEYGYAPRGPERVRLDAIVAAARAEGLDGLTVAMVADAIHPEGQGPTIDCCMGSTVESLYPPDEAARLHRKHHEEAATRFLAYLAARRRLPRAPR